MTCYKIGTILATSARTLDVDWLPKTQRPFRVSLKCKIEVEWASWSEGSYSFLKAVPGQQKITSQSHVQAPDSGQI